jgi:hypothetical protein
MFSPERMTMPRVYSFVALPLLSFLLALFGAGVIDPNDCSDRAVSGAFLPDGSGILLHMADGRLDLWNTQTGQFQRTIAFTPVTKNRSYQMALNPTGTLAALWRGEPEIELWDLQSGSLQGTLPTHAIHTIRLAFSPDGRLLFDGYTLFSLDADQRSVAIDAGEHSQFVFSPDSRILFTVSQQRGLREWDAASGRIDHVWWEEGPLSPLIALSLDGTTLAVGSIDVTIYDVATHQPLRQFSPRSGDYQEFIAFLPDDQQMIVDQGWSEYSLWRWSDDARLYRFTRLYNPYALSPDGRRILEIDTPGVRDIDLASPTANTRLYFLCPSSRDYRWLAAAGGIVVSGSIYLIWSRRKLKEEALRAVLRYGYRSYLIALGLFFGLPIAVYILVLGIFGFPDFTFIWLLWFSAFIWMFAAALLTMQTRWQLARINQIDLVDGCVIYLIMPALPLAVCGGFWLLNFILSRGS